MADQAADRNDVRAANDAFYKALSAGSIEDISAACAHDDDVTSLHENGKVAIGWGALLDSRAAVPVRCLRRTVGGDGRSSNQGERPGRPRGGVRDGPGENEGG